MPLKATQSGVELRVRASPKASRNELAGVYEDAAGQKALRVRVTAPPDKGKANKAILKLLAKTWGLAPSCLSVITGGHNRTKVILIEGEPGVLVATLRPWLEET